LDYLGLPCITLDYHGLLWRILDHLGVQWINMDVHRWPRITLDNLGLTHKTYFKASKIIWKIYNVLTMHILIVT
jgi:hypothetical protein